MASDFDFDLPLNQYFLSEVAEHLESKGINCLDDLIDAMYGDPERWATRLDLNKERSNGILSWLYSKKLGGAPIDFPPVLETRARDLSKSYYGQKVEDVGAPLWSEINKKQKTGRRLGQPLKNSEIRPLEFLTPPKALDGSSGTNRGDRQDCALNVNTDIEAIRLWLKAKGTNANTQAAYRREAERFLLWCLLEKRVALSSARLEECSEYLKWLEMIGRETPENWQKSWIYPQETWIGPKNTPRESPDWKPFNSSLAYTSRKAASTIVRQLFSFLHKTGYLKFNPFDQIPAKVRFLPGEGKPKEFADRSLSPAQWEEIKTHLAQLPLDLVRMRLEVLFVLGKELGMRASEMINARCGWIEYSRFGDEETVVIDIVGKGDKQRRLPLSSEQVDKISRYLAARKRPPLFEPTGKDVPLIASFRIGNKGADKEGLSRSGLYIVLHTFLEEVANDVRKKNPRDAAKLLGSSLHWLRHTFAVASLEVMPVNVVQTAMGHASVNTTTRYISPDQTEVLEGFKKLNPNFSSVSKRLSPRDEQILKNETFAQRMILAAVSLHQRLVKTNQLLKIRALHLTFVSFNVFRKIPRLGAREYRHQIPIPSLHDRNDRSHRYILLKG